MSTCRHCGQPVQQINYSFGGKTWMHVEPNASFPTERKGTAWRYCKTQIAEPATEESK